MPVVAKKASAPVKTSKTTKKKSGMEGMGASLDDKFFVLHERIIRVEEELSHQREMLIFIQQSVDKRFEEMHRYMDKRFEAMDKRFEAVDKRFEDMQKSMDKRFEDMQRYMDKRFSMLQWLIGLGFSLLAIVIAIMRVL
jgi:uncharacterized protein VirK/YbjX